MDPLISIVVPTCNRPMLLKRLLDSLSMQDLPAHSFEVIIVSDGPDRQTSEMIKALTDQGFANLVHLMLGKRSGPAAARNKGWLHACADLIAFTDDDCIAEPSWAASYLDAWQGERLIAFTGRVEVPVPAICTDHENNIRGLETAEFITANCCLSRQALEVSGGFDEHFKLAWREDSDLHFKLLQNNIPLLKIEEARVIHPVRGAGWGVSIKEQKKSLYDALLYKKFPLLYRQRIASDPPFLYYGMILAFIAGVCLMLMKSQTFVFLVPWLLLVFYFTWKRIRYTSRSISHIMEMIITSAIIPFLSVFWRIKGAIRFKILFI